MLGGLLGDFVHGAIPESYPERVRAGIRLHRAIDVFTDGHPAVHAARATFVAPFRRYAGILLDVWFDHLLARDFVRWSAEPLDVFSARLQALLTANAMRLPAGLARFAAYMRRHNLPRAYAEPAVIGQVLTGIGGRLRHANPLERALPELLARKTLLAASFTAFFPALIKHVQALRGRQTMACC